MFLFLLAVLAIAAGAAAQGGLTDPPPSSPASEPTPSPDDEQIPDEPEEPNVAPPAEQSQESEQEHGAREGTVPDEGEEASSDRIQYRDPLDIDEEPVKLKWKNFVSGLRGITQYSLLDRQLRFRLGFRLQADGTLVAPSDRLEAALGPMPDSFDLRRARIFAEGIFRRMYFRVEFDFATDAGFKTGYLEGQEGGLAVWGHLLGKFRYGYFQEPFSLENNVSSFDTAFVEYAMPANTIGPGNNLGAMVYDASKNRRFTWAAGAFSWGRATADNASTSLLSLTGRFGYQPVDRNDGVNALHIGFSVSTRTPTSDRVRYEARPEARFVRPFADTGDVPASRNTLFCLETAWKQKNTWAQVEWIRSNLSTAAESDPHFSGLTIQAGRFLTGYSRPWDNLFGVWGRVRPDNPYRGGNPFKRASGGEWEVAARYSSVDLDDGEVKGGVVRDITLGINWYPRTTWKLQFNWIHSRVEDVGYANIWVLRYQYAIK
jgi:phosphate-selective porin OprO/OprP